jgi:hypothetical protein
VKVPPGLRVEEGDAKSREGGYREPAPRAERRLVITREWIDPSAGLTGLMAVVVDGAATAAFVFAHAHPLGIALGIVLAAGGVVTTYDAAGRIINGTRIVVAGDRLTAVHGPLPWPGHVSVPIANVTRVVAQTIAKRHGVTAVVSGEPVRLASDLDAAQAAFIAARLSQELGV